MRVIRTILADDHPAFLAGVRAHIDAESDIVVIEEATNGQDALDATIKLLPDVLLLDMELPLLSGLEVASQLQEREVPVHVLPLSGYSDPGYVMGVLESGADGYICKDESLPDIVNGIRKVINGGVYFSSRIAIDIVRSRRERFTDESELEQSRLHLDNLGITTTLLRILRLVGQGLNDKEIAKIVFRSPHTVRNHIDKLKTLTNVRWRPALVAWSWKNNIMLLESEDIPASEITTTE